MQTNQVLYEENAVVKGTCPEVQCTIDSQLKDADISKNEYETKCSEFTNEITLLKKTNADLEKEKSELQTSTEQLTEKYDTSKQESKQRDDVIISLKPEIDRQKSEISMYSQESLNLSLENKSVNEELGQSKKLLQEKDGKIGQANHEINELKDRQNQLELQQKKNSEELARVQQNYVKLKTNLRTQTEENEKQLAELKGTKEELDHVNREMKELHHQNSRNNDTIVAVRKEADNIRKETKILSEELGILLKKHELTALELAQWKSLKLYKLYSSSRGDMLSAVEKELMAMLKSKLENERLKLELIQCSKQSEIQPDIPTLLMCITASASRLGEHGTHAIQGLTLMSRMALMIFHHTIWQVCPSQASERILTGSEINGIGGIFDIAFRAGSGLHSNCQLNNNTFRKPRYRKLMISHIAK